MKCTEAYTIIQRYMQYSSSYDAKEARTVMQQFKEDFEKTDEALDDPILKDVCIHLAETHFSRPDALRTKPCSTIREEYRKRTGRSLDEFYCEKAYLHAAEEKKAAYMKAEEEKRNEETTALSAEKTSVIPKNTAGHSSGIIDAENRLRENGGA